MNDTWSRFWVIFHTCDGKYDTVRRIVDVELWFCFKGKSKARCILSAWISIYAGGFLVGSIRPVRSRVSRVRRELPLQLCKRYLDEVEQKEPTDVVQSDEQ